MILSDTTIERFLNDRDWSWCTRYGEPGYGSIVGGERIVLGSYWCRCGDNPNAGRKTWGSGKIETISDMHTFEDHHPRFWHQLEEQGVEFEWHDEWEIVGDPPKAYRTTADSYSWQPSIIMSDDDEWLTPDTPLEEWVAGYLANNPRRALPGSVFTGDDLEAIGFVRHNGEFAAGWFDGQNDNPVDIHNAIRADHPDDTIVFALDESSQFYSKFSAYHRPPQEVNA